MRGNRNDLASLEVAAVATCATYHLENAKAGDGDGLAAYKCGNECVDCAVNDTPAVRFVELGVADSSVNENFCCLHCCE